MCSFLPQRSPPSPASPTPANPAIIKHDIEMTQVGKEGSIKFLHAKPQDDEEELEIKIVSNQ